MSSLETELARLQAELDASRRELEVARAEVIRLRNLLGLDRPVPEGPRDGRLFAPEPLPSAVEVVQGPITRWSSPAAKLALFRRLFAARTDVFAVRWENRSSAKAGWMPARTGGRDGPLRSLSDDVLRAHLEGRDHVGVYPLRQGDVCTLLACDFDGSSWALDARAVHDAAVSVGLQPVLERSRSGQGAHQFPPRGLPALAGRGIGWPHGSADRM